MKVIVAVQINYDYEAEVPDSIDGQPVTVDDILFLSDADDPAYEKICRVFHEANLSYVGNTISVQNAETGEEIWAQ